MPIQFFSEDVSFELESPTFFSKWLVRVILDHNTSLGDINYIFCSDEYLLKINKEHLNHDFFTDIITFDNSESDEVIEADIFISIERVRENAADQSVSFNEELSRVLVHGLLHLLGFGDKTESEKKVMREKENACISLQEK